MEMAQAIIGYNNTNLNTNGKLNVMLVPLLDSPLFLMFVKKTREVKDIHIDRVPLLQRPLVCQYKKT